MSERLIPRRHARVLSQWADAELILLHIDSGEYFALHGAGGRIWELCDGRRDAAAITAVLCEEYDAPPDVVAADVADMLRDLAAARVVTLEESPRAC